MRDIVVVIPTYNEAANIGPLLERLDEVERHSQYDFTIVVVDDDSPDGTGRLVAEAREGDDRLDLVTGSKEGLGRAYVRGFRHVLREHPSDAVVMMDADFSHDPQAIPRLLEKLQEGFDYVIGSRYVEHASIPGDWPMWRILNSRVANYVATRLAGIGVDVRDVSGGFKAIRTDALRDIDLEGVTTPGYGFQMHLLHAFQVREKRIAEVPTTFRDRTRGTSKMRLRDVTGFLWCAYSLDPASPIRQLMRFASVGAFGSLVNLVVLALLLGASRMPDLGASALATQAAILVNFVLHESFTFRPGGGMPGTRGRRLAQYQAASLGSALVTVSAFALLHQVGGMPALLAQALGILLGFAANALVATRIIWRRHALR
jgi:dolichol-phosphate mannosyltransferase